jgi:hypothetical protein
MTRFIPDRITLYRAIFSGTGGELDRIESPTINGLRKKITEAMAAEWQLMPGDSIQIEEVV